MQNNSRKVQRRIFHLISQKVKSRGLKMEDLAKMLHIGKSALYARISGKKLLPFDELLLLSKEFNISLDKQCFQPTSRISVEFPYALDESKSSKHFVQRLLKRLEEALALEGMSIRYISSEIPVFYYFRFKELSLFKLFIYDKAIWEHAGISSKVFNFEKLDDPEYDSLFEQVHDRYMEIPSVEIWGGLLIDNTLNQLKYYAQAGILSYNKHCRIICDQLEELLDTLAVSAEMGYKHGMDGSQKGSFSLHHNEVLRVNNTIIVDSPKQQQLFFTYDDPNYFICEDDCLIEYSTNWFNTLQRRSHLVSQNSERNRMMLFNLTHGRLEEARAFLKRFEY